MQNKHAIQASAPLRPVSIRKTWLAPEITGKSVCLDAAFGGNPNFIDGFSPATNGTATS